MNLENNQPEVNTNSARYKAYSIVEFYNEEWSSFVESRPEALIDDYIAKFIFMSNALKVEISEQYGPEVIKFLKLEKSKYDAVLQAYYSKQGTTRITRLADLAPEFIAEYNSYTQSDLQDHPNNEQELFNSKSILNDFILYNVNPFSLGDK